ncbi:general secretion pathway protein GspK [Pseudodesulfovibrio tunisiensis]|uniref:general secretion pathway protein GspK n=1 Tax=Pseudodesulfovibrio tunisiensis TaxID=463192 RepID=UPI001FB340FF|nr:type II secretion system protein GspK [Pseudodesulfovibrio tunisiensis]
MRQPRKEGSVLIVVLLILAAAAYLVMESGKVVRIDYGGAAYQRCMASGGSLLRSGVDVARELLMQDLRKHGDVGDHKFDQWARADRFFETLSSGLESGELAGTIVPENSRINLNHLRQQDELGKALAGIFLRLMRGLCATHGVEGNPNVLLQSIRVWLGAKDLSGDAAWYGDQDPSYAAPRRPFNCAEELLLVRWEDVSREDFQRLYFGRPGAPGLEAFVTVWGEGRLNVNTARSEMLGAMAPEGRYRAEFVKAVLGFRNNGANNLSEPWYLDLAERIGFDMDAFPSKALIFRSRYFRVTLSATIGAGKLGSTTIIKREDKLCRVLFNNVH